MKIAAVIAEFNPFHNGHKYLCDQARVLGADTVIAVMSGNWVQRGDTAVISKFSRTRQALKNGYDLVAELPTHWAMSTAMTFADGAVEIAMNLGANMLVFGSECGDTPSLIKTAYTVRSPEFDALVKTHLASGTSLAKAREQAAETLCRGGEHLRNSNDILAVEYIRAAKEYNNEITFHAVKRIGVNHDSTVPQGDICSAGMLRDLISKGKLCDTAKYMPKKAYEILKESYENGKISDLKRLEKPILAFLRTATAEHYKKLPDISEGIENRIFSAVRMSSSLDDLFNYTASKRYTNARLRRLIISAALGADKDRIPKSVPYIRVLGCNSTGAEVLSLARKTSNLPIIMRAISLKENEVFKFEDKATDIYSLSMLNPDDCGTEFTNGVIVIKD